MLTLGSTLGANLRLDGFLGEGASGLVYRAHHLALGIDVAVKVLKVEAGAQDPRYLQRFQREARSLARLDHPGIVRVLDVGSSESTHFLVMELVEGLSLEQYLVRRKDPCDESTVLRIVGAIAAALAAAHRAGIIHRDLKPGNILINRRGQLKVADLGMSRDEQDAAQLTRERSVVGTPAFMAPESLQPGHMCDNRVDIYALGVIAYRLLYGRLPYTGSITQVITGHISGRARFDLHTTCGKRTITIVRKLMATDPDQRYANAELVVAEIRQILFGQRQAPSGSSELFGLGRMIEKGLGASTSEKGGQHIIHTTTRERLLVWLLLFGVIALAVTGLILGTATEDVPPVKVRAPDIAIPVAASAPTLDQSGN